MITIDFLNDVFLEDRISAFKTGGDVAFLALVGTAILTDDETGKEVEVSGDLFMIGVDKKKLLDEVAEEYYERPLRILSLETNFKEEMFGGPMNNSPLPLGLSNAEVHALAKDDVRVSIPLGFEGEFGLKVEFEDDDEFIGWSQPATGSMFIAGASDEMKAGFYDVSGVRMEDAAQVELALESKGRDKRSRLNELALLSYDSDLKTHAPTLADEIFYEEPQHHDLTFDDAEDHVEHETVKGDACLENHYMSRKHLRILKDYACDILEMLDAGVELPEWIEAHITVAATYIRDSKHVLEHGDFAEKDQKH